MARLVGIFVTLLLLHNFAAMPVSAQTITLSATDSATASPPAEIQYELPYPGILPDHPLYFLKVFRDRLVGFLINDPVKRAEFNLLQSDKKIFAARLLFDKDKEELGIETLSKSTNYMHNAISEAKRAGDAKKNIDGIRGQIGTSIKKHKEIITDLTKSHDTSRNSLDGEQKRLEEIEKFYRTSFPIK